MSNPLTGHFEAVLQVSGSTINRLLASLHQNAFENPNLPSFQHSVRMRIGDDYAYQGVRGVVHAQFAVPRVELIHGVTDRFMFEVGVCAWYRPDPGTEPMPAFIHGTVRAEYRVQAINPSCLGWSRKKACRRAPRQAVGVHRDAQRLLRQRRFIACGARAVPVTRVRLPAGRALR